MQCAILGFSFFSFVHGQSSPSTSVVLKSIQMDITSALFFNRLSLYSDVDIYKKGPSQNSYGFQAGADLTHLFGLVKVPEGFPVRNVYFALRASSTMGQIPINMYLSYVNGASLRHSKINRSGTFIKMGADVNKYFWDNKLGLRFKLDLPVYTLSGTDNGFYVGLGLVIGYLKY